MPQPPPSSPPQILTITEFCTAAMSLHSPLIGLDIGAKTIGVALAHMPSGIVTPHKVITRTKIAKDAAILSQVINDYNVGGIVIGWPLNADGTLSRRCQATRDIWTELSKHLPHRPACFYDERFSTQKAEDFMIKKIDYSRKKRDQIIDKMAAQLILSEFLIEHMGVPPAYS
ncbi:MAG: Holliday junction resolvase RuvX [Alphaproteobacteria bacterium]|nr:Holliday junction resolvase RuvX [Alphaproteobacteria bacterium]